MRSIPLTMTWEMLRHGRWGLLAAALGANLLPAILISALRYEGALDSADPSQIVIHIVLVQINMLIFAAAVFTASWPGSIACSIRRPTLAFRFELRRKRSAGPNGARRDGQCLVRSCSACFSARSPG